MATLQMNILSMKLGMQENFTVILPSFVPKEENAGKTPKELYPRGEKFRTLWLLNSEYGDDSELLKYTGILRYAEDNNLAVVLPCGHNTLYSEEPKGQKFLAYITEELWAVCTGNFPLSTKREDNFIGGISLGAYGALKAALKYPEKYSAALLVGGAFGENMKEGYLAAVNANISKNGLIPHMPLDDTLPDDAELAPLAEAIINDKKPMPKIYMAWAEKSPIAEYSSKGALALANCGFNVTSDKYTDSCDNWSFRDAALGKAINSWLPLSLN